MILIWKTNPVTGNSVSGKKNPLKDYYTRSYTKLRSEYPNEAMLLAHSWILKKLLTKFYTQLYEYPKP